MSPKTKKEEKAFGKAELGAGQGWWIWHDDRQGDGDDWHLQHGCQTIGDMPACDPHLVEQIEVRPPLGRERTLHIPPPIADRQSFREELRTSLATQFLESLRVRAEQVDREAGSGGWNRPVLELRPVENAWSRFDRKHRHARCVEPHYCQAAGLAEAHRAIQISDDVHAVAPIGDPHRGGWVRREVAQPRRGRRQ